jgi:hypothetical protein
MDERGFSVLQELQIGKWLTYNGKKMHYIYRVTFPADVNFHINKFNILTVDKMILSCKMTIEDFFATYPEAEKILIEGIKCGMMIEDFPQSYPMTSYMAKLFVFMNWSNIQFIDEKLMDEELLESAIKGNYSALRFIPKHLLSSKVLEQAIGKNYRSLNFIPESLRTPKILSVAKKHKDYDNFHVGVVSLETIQKVETKPVRGRFMDLSDIFDDEYAPPWQLVGK